MTLDTFSRHNRVFFPASSMGRAVLPLPFTMTRFGTKLLGATIAPLNWVKHFFTPNAYSFFKSKVRPSLKSIMMFPVLLVSGQMKVFKSIVGFVFVDMMDNFFWKKLSSNMFSHNIPMLKGLNGSLKHWIVRCVNKDISRGMASFTASPIMVVFASINALRNAINSFNDLFHVMIIGRISSEVKT